METKISVQLRTFCITLPSLQLPVNKNKWWSFFPGAKTVVKGWVIAVLSGNLPHLGCRNFPDDRFSRINAIRERLRGLFSRVSYNFELSGRVHWSKRRLRRPPAGCVQFARLATQGASRKAQVERRQRAQVERRKAKGASRRAQVERRKEQGARRHGPLSVGQRFSPAQNWT